MKVQSLNGVWNYRIGKGKRRKRQVPFSTLPVGYSECSRTFIPEVLSEKTFLKFDGITYAAKVFLNGKLLGEMLPYSEYTFEITDVVCRENDPTRLVSGANCMSDEDTLKYYQLCGFDFYTMHPYSQTIDRAKHSAAVLSDKPLVFTEWGGHFVYNNPKLLAEFMEEMYGMYERNSDEGALAHCGTLCHVPVVIADGVSLEIPVICQDRLAKITVRSLNRGYEVLLYGIGWAGFSR